MRAASSRVPASRPAAARTAIPAPPRLPADEKRVAPFVRYELIEDRYEKEHGGKDNF